MRDKTRPHASSSRDRHRFVDPTVVHPGTDFEAARETPLEEKVRAARGADSDHEDPADRRRGMSEVQVSRLSPPVLVILLAVALALIVLLLVFGGVI